MHAPVIIDRCCVHVHSELKQTVGGRDEEASLDSDDLISETGSDHVTMVGGAPPDQEDDDIIPHRTESPSREEEVGDEVELVSTASNPLEDSEFFERCQVRWRNDVM